MDPETLIEIITATGLTRMKVDVKASLDKKKKENDQLGQLGQQVQQLDQQLKQTTAEAQKLQQEIQKLNAEKMQLERERFQFEKELEWFKANDDSSFNNSKLDLDKKRVQLEAAQLLDANHRNDEIKND